MTYKLTKKEVQDIKQALARKVKEGMSWGDRTLLALVLLMGIFFPGIMFASTFVAAAKYSKKLDLSSMSELFSLLAQSEYEL